MVTDPNIPQTMATIAMNYKPAIAETEMFVRSINQANDAVLKLQTTTMKSMQAPVASATQQFQQSGVILDRYGKTLSAVDMNAQKIADSTQTATRKAEEHSKTVKDMASSYSILGSQWDRKISWFIAGAGFYGGIRAIQSAVSAFTEVESSMIVIQRTVNDLAVDFDKLRDQLIEAGMEFGHTWGTVQEVAIRWAQAGYEADEILELTRKSLLSLNVAQMDVEMATQGLIAIMAQWGFTAEDLEGVIDKLNITSDNYAVTTGDLVAALQRSSGAATALGLTFEETVGLITAMRVASGRLGAEVGNALNTILSYITRQSTLNKLMESGVNVFADTAGTKLRPAMELLVEISDKWNDISEDNQLALVDLAESMGMMSEEMAEMAGLQEEWTQLQKLDLETSIAGVRRRNFLIALFKNFAQAQEVVLNMENSLGYSMRQNEQTMETLAKQYEQLKMAATQLAVAIGDTGLMNGIKRLVETTTDAITWFNSLDSSLQTLVVTFAQVSLGVKVLGSLLKMAGVTALIGQLAASGGALAGFASLLGGPVVSVMVALVAALVALELVMRKNAEEYEKQVKLASVLADEHDRLTEAVKWNMEGTIEHTNAMNNLNDLNIEIAQQFPELVQGFDDTTGAILINKEALDELREAHEKLQDVRREELSQLDALQSKYESALDSLTAQGEQLGKNTEMVAQFVNRRKELVEALEKESEGTERAEQIKKDIAYAEERLIDIIGEQGLKRLEAAGFTEDAVNLEVEKIKEKVENIRQARITALQAQIDETQEVIENTKTRITAMAQEIAQIRQLRAERNLWEKQKIFTWREDMRYKGLTEGIEEYLDVYKDAMADLDKLDKKIKEWQDKDLFAGAPDGRGAPPPPLLLPPGASGAAQSLSDLMRRFIEQTLAQADAQKLVNAAVQRNIDLFDTRISYYQRDTASITEQVKALTEQAKVTELLKEKRSGIEQETSRLREAITRLEAKQRATKTTTDEGRQAYEMLGSEIESLKERVNRLNIEWWQLEQAMEIGIDSLERVWSLRQANIDALESEIKYLTRERATKEELVKADELREQLLTVYVEQLHELNYKLIEQNKHLEIIKQAYLSGAITLEQYNQAMVDITGSINSLSTQLFGVKIKMDDLSHTAYSQATAFDTAKEAIERYSKFGVMSIESQISALHELNTLKSLSARDEMWLQDKLFNHYRDILRQQQKEIEEAYRERIKLIDEEADKRIAVIQAEIDLLDQEATLETREEAERQHNQKITDLKEQIRYHELRTGKEHGKAIVDLKRQVEEEQRRWELKQSEWVRQDKKDVLNKEIQDIRDNAEEQKKEWEKAYQRMQADFNDHNINMIALAATHDEKWLQDGLNKANRWLEGFESGMASGLKGGHLGDLVGELPPIKDMIKTPDRKPKDDTGKEPDYAPTYPEPKTITISGGFDNVDGRTYMPARSLGSILGESVSWDAVNKRVNIGGYVFSPFTGKQKYADALSKGTAWVGIREVAGALGYIVDWLDGTIKLVKASEGGIAYRPTLGIFAEAGDPEALIPLPKLQPMLADALKTAIRAEVNIGGFNTVEIVYELRQIGRLLKAMPRDINIDKLFHAEHVGFEDRIDMEIHNRELVRAIKRL